MMATRQQRRSEAEQTVGVTASWEESIRSRAYGLYEQRGGADGHDWDDWLRAERELRSEHAEEPVATREAS
jgi:hypothetical protein